MYDPAEEKALAEPWELPVCICITVHLPFLSHATTIMTKCFNYSLVFFEVIFTTCAYPQTTCCYFFLFLTLVKNSVYSFRDMLSLINVMLVRFICTDALGVTPPPLPTAISIS